MALDEAEIDFVAAAGFLRQAREAHEAAEEATFIAARQMVLIALGLPVVPAFVQRKRNGAPQTRSA